jgi:hypothetical protein
MLTKPGLLLRIEGSFVLALSLFLYWQNHLRWWMFVALLLLPDLSMIGYLAGAKNGSRAYNLIHTLTGPLVLVGYSLASAHLWLLPYGLIWTAHIGLDRMLGYGLKYPTQFKDTHLQHV